MHRCIETSSGLMAQFMSTPEAREYRESLALRAEQSSTAAISEESQFPDALFSAAALAGDAADV
jgi:hypothetical protein